MIVAMQIWYVWYFAAYPHGGIRSRMKCGSLKFNKKIYL